MHVPWCLFLLCKNLLGSPGWRESRCIQALFLLYCFFPFSQDSTLGGFSLMCLYSTSLFLLQCRGTVFTGVCVSTRGPSFPASSQAKSTTIFTQNAHTRISCRIKPLIWMPIYLEANKTHKQKTHSFYYVNPIASAAVLCLLSPGAVSHPVCHIHLWERTQLPVVLWQAEPWDPLSPPQMAVLPPCCVITVYKIQKKPGEWLAKEWCTGVLMFAVKKKVNTGSFSHVWISWKWVAGILPCF